MKDGLPPVAGSSPAAKERGRGGVRRVLRGGWPLAATYGIAGGAGFLASRLDMPLPWLLGPFFICAVLSASGLPLASMRMGREIGQVIVGLAVGLRFTPAVLTAALVLLPAMLLSTVYVIAVTLIAALMFRPLARVDVTTAFFATAAGGMADMALVARQFGGDPNAVAIVHALRVSGVVAVVPMLVVAFGVPGTAADGAAGLAQNPLLLALALAVAAASAVLLRPTPLPNPWLVGPIFVGIALGGSGLLALRVPSLLIVLAQVLIGTWLGSQFKREILVTLPRVASAGIVASLFMIAAAGLGALVLAALTPLPLTTSFLALAPAAVTEMVITAQAMHLDAEIVTAFHVMRIGIVSSTILLVFSLYRKLVGSLHGSRI